MSSLDFSVIIPTCERPAALRRCLGSAVRLEYPRDRVEVIVVNDGGSHTIENVVDEFASGATIRVYHRENGGPAAARNTGMGEARGRHLVFLDDDCEVSADALNELTALFRCHPDALIGARQSNALTANACAALSQMVLDVVYEVYNPGPENTSFIASYFLAASADLLEAAGGFDVAFRISEDRELCDRWRSLGRGIVVADNIHVRHHHDLTLKGLWRQHFAYGQGAYAYHRRRASLGRGGLKIERGFYRALMAAPFRAAHRRTALLLSLLLLYQQVANAAGYLYARLRTDAS
ncbi:MAG: glycosyltransferase [Verrucomicrobia bacterium]|nr:glycosyltransferase [Verrucomicrobiota bacterium]MDA1086136.1 glycosyltransferase [Verrucomicrobiota bacterium]